MGFLAGGSLVTAFRDTAFGELELMLLGANSAKQIYARVLRQKVHVARARTKTAFKFLPGLWTAKDELPQYRLRKLARDRTAEGYVSARPSLLSEACRHRVWQLFLDTASLGAAIPRRPVWSWQSERAGRSRVRTARNRHNYPRRPPFAFLFATVNDAAEKLRIALLNPKASAG
jgi:hypothetical protein